MLHGIFNRPRKGGPPYVEEFDLFTDRLESAIKSNQSTKISTERIVAASAFNEDFNTLYNQNSSNLRSFFLFLKKLYKEYEPGKPLTVPIVNGTPYGLSIEIKVPLTFEVSEFDEMVQREWSSHQAYSWEKPIGDSKESVATQGVANGIVSATNGILLLAVMKLYAAVFIPGLERSYTICNGDAGIRFITTDEANYIDISGGETSYEVALETAEDVANYLDRNEEEYRCS